MVLAVIEYTETFNDSTDLTITHLSRWSDEISVLDKIENTIDIFENSVSNNPLIYPVSPSLFDVTGISNVREANINGYRILYEVGEREKEAIVTALLLLGQKQSIKEQLTKHCLMYR
jgi:hypothetical protein